MAIAGVLRRQLEPIDAATSCRSTKPTSAAIPKTAIGRLDAINHVLDGHRDERAVTSASATTAGRRPKGILAGSDAVLQPTPA